MFLVRISSELKVIGDRWGGPPAGRFYAKVLKVLNPGAVPRL